MDQDHNVINDGHGDKNNDNISIDNGKKTDTLELILLNYNQL